MTPQQALARLQGLCSKGEYCCRQVREKLSKWREASLVKGEPAFSEDEIDEIVRKLVEDKFVDDARFASAYVRDKARFNRWGEVKIAYSLRKLGVGQSVIQVALEENRELFADEVLCAMLQKKWNQLGPNIEPETKREKLIRFAVGRGYSYGQIMGLIKKFR